MESANPYAAPSADIAEANTGYDTTSVFSPKGRFGRLSYLAWSASVSFVIGLILSVVLGATMGLNPEAGGMMLGANLLVQVAVFAVTVMFIIRRLHDISASGWWSLLMLVPLVNVVFGLVLVIKRGSDSANRFGPPRQTLGWEKVVGSIVVALLVLGVVGVVAAVAIPAFVATP